LAEKESAPWEQAWALHTARFAAEITALREAARERKAPPAQYTPEQLQELAFGAYVGLVREQGGSTAAGYATESQVVRVRQTALSRLQELATAGGRGAAVRPVLVQVLGDPNQAVRMQAFDALVRLLREAREERPQRRLIEALEGLGDPRAADAFLDRIENDPDGTALVEPLFEAAGGFRRPETADRLLAMAGNEKWRKPA